MKYRKHATTVVLAPLGVFSRLRGLFLHIFCFYLMLGTMPVWANPSGGTVAAGSATISSTPGQVTVEQASDKAVINWQSFSIGAGELTRFNQPGAASITLNRVVGGDLSQIMGQLRANGQVFLVNPNGVVFGSGSVVDVGGLVATTSDISDENFMAGRFVFDTPSLPDAAVVNDGSITVAEGGLLALVAPQVENNGTLTARLGRVSLASGNRYSLDLYGDNLITLAVDDEVAGGLLRQINHTGAIVAEGGTVTLDAARAAGVLDSVINTEGIIEAGGAMAEGGKIVLHAAGDGLVRVNGTLRANSTVGQGGQVHVLGEKVLLRENAVLDTSGATGGGEILAGGDYQGGGDLRRARISAVSSGAQLSADAAGSGDGGKVIVWADDTTVFHGSVSARGGAEGGNGGLMEISGKHSLLFNGSADASAPHGQTGTLLLDPDDIVIVDGAGPAADDAEVTGDDTILAADGGAVTFTISEGAIEGLGPAANLVLQANNDITLNDLTDDNLNLTNTASVVFTADADGNNAGSFIMSDASDRLRTSGTDISISAADMTLGEVSTSLAMGGNINLTATTGAITQNANIVTWGGDIVINGDIAPGGAANISTTGGAAGDITINGDLDGAQIVTLTAGSGSISVNGTWGGVTPLTSFSASGTGGVDVDAITTTGTQAFTGTTTLGGNLTTTNNDITFNSAVTLNGGVNISSGAGGGNINFASTINGGQALAVNAGVGSLTLGGDVGGVTPLTSLVLTSNTLNLGNITTTGAQTFNGATTLNGDLVSSGGLFSFNNDMSLGGASTVTSGGGNVVFSGTLNGAETFNVNAGAGSVTFSGDVGDTTDLAGLTASGASVGFSGIFESTGTSSVTAGAGDVTFASTVDGAQVFSAVASGDVIFSGAVGGTTPLTSLAANGTNVSAQAVDTTANQTYTGTTTLNADIASSAGAIAINGDLSLPANRVITSGGGAGDDITITGSVTDDVDLSLSAGLNGDISLGIVDVNDLLLVGDQLTLNGDVTVDNAINLTPVNSVVLAGNSTLTANDGGTDYNIVLDAGNDISGNFNLGLAGDTIGLYQVNGVNTVTVNAATALTLNDFVSSNGAQSYSGPATVNGDLTTTNDGITFNDAVSLGGNIAMDTGAGAGNIGFVSTVDGNQTLSATAGTGTVTFGGAVGGTTPLAGVTASGASVSFNSTFESTGTSTITATTGNATFTGAVDGAQALTASAAAGTVQLSADVGGTTPLTSLSASGVNVNTQAVTTTGNQDYTGIAAAAGALDSTGGAIDVTGSLNAASTIDAAGNITTSGDLTAANTVTTTGGLVSVGGNADLSGDVTTSGGNIGVTGNTTLSASPLALSTGGGAGDISLSGTVNGASDLTLTAGTGAVALGGAVGGSTPLNSLSASGSGGVSLADVTTTGTQDYTGATILNGDLATTNSDVDFNSAVTLGGASTVNTGAGAGTVTLSSTVDGAATLGITAGTGDVVLTGNVGSVTPLTGLTGSGANVSLGGDFESSGTSTLTAATGNVAVAGATEGPQNLSATASAGTVTFTGDAGAATPLGDVTLSATAVTFGGTFDAGGTSGVTATAGNATFTGAVNGAQDLTVTATAGTVDFLDNVGNVTPLGDVTANAGVVSFGGTFEATGTSNLTASTGNVTFTGDVDGPQNLTATAAAGTIDFLANAGAATPLGDVTLSATAVTLGGTFDAGGTSGVTATAGNATFTGAVNGAQDLTVSASGTAQFAAAVGGVTPLTSLDVTGSTAVDMQAVTTSGDQDYTGPTTLNADINSTAGAITITGNLSSPANRLITSGGGVGDNVTITGSMTDDVDLSIVAGSGNISLGVIDANDLILSGGQLTINGDITSDTALDFTSVANIVLGAHSVVTANNGGPDLDITFDAANVITGNRNLTLNGDTVTLYRINGARNLTVNSTTGATLNDTVSTNGTQTYNGPTTVTNSLTTTNDNITFNDVVLLTGDSIMNSGAGAGNITFNNTVNGAQNLTASAGTGNVAFNAQVGGVTPLTSLTATGTNITAAQTDTTADQTYTGATTLTGDLTSATGAITINGNATLTGNRVLTSGGGVGDDITITGSSSGDFILEIIAGLADVAMGGADLDTWLLTSGVQLSIGGTFLTDTAQDFTNMANIVLTADTWLTANDGGASPQDITFDAANVITGPYDLTIDGNNVVLHQIGDGVNNPVDLTVTGAGSVTVNDVVQTDGNQLYNSIDGLGNDMYSNGGNITFNTPLTLLNNVLLDTGPGGGDVLFMGTVDGTFDLNITAGTGTVTALDNMGYITPLASLAIPTASAINLLGVRTIGTQTYGAPVSLGGDLTSVDSDITFGAAVTLVNDITIDTGSGAGNIDFQSTLDGTYDLTMDAGTGDIDFDADVGGTARLGTVTVTSTHDFTMLGTTKVTELYQTFGTGTTDYGWWQGLDASGRVEIDTTPNVAGRIITAGDTILRASESVTGEVHVNSLVLAAQNADLFGTVRGQTDRDAARLVILETVTPGPYLMNGFAMPVVGDVISADTIFTDDSSRIEGNVRVYVNTVDPARRLFNPFSEPHQLVLASEGMERTYGDVAYLYEPVWEYVRRQPSRRGTPVVRYVD